MRALVIGVLALAVASCGQPSPPPTAAPTPTPAPADAPATPALSVSELWAAPNNAFEAVEPTVFGVIGGAAVWDALDPLGRSYEGGEGAPTLTAYIRTSGADQIADVVRTGLADDSIASEHIRIEFRREPEGWYPTNAYRRQMCARGANAGQWSAAPCP